jgi:hypothetical protein
MRRSSHRGCPGDRQWFFWRPVGRMCLDVGGVRSSALTALVASFDDQIEGRLDYSSHPTQSGCIEHVLELTWTRLRTEVLR